MCVHVLTRANTLTHTHRGVAEEDLYYFRVRMQYKSVVNFVLVVIKSEQKARLSK